MATVRRPTDTAAHERANELIRSFDARAGSLGSFLGRVTAVDQVGVEERVDSLKRRSIKAASKLWALDLAIRMIDLTTLEGKDTPGKIRALCAKAIQPLPGDASIPHVAAICVYPALVAEAKRPSATTVFGWPASRPASHPARPSSSSSWPRSARRSTRARTRSTW
jgi:deoxyribose-phosphate aldolase